MVPTNFPHRFTTLPVYHNLDSIYTHWKRTPLYFDINAEGQRNNTSSGMISLGSTQISDTPEHGRTDRTYESLVPRGGISHPCIEMLNHTLLVPFRSNVAPKLLRSQFHI